MAFTRKMLKGFGLSDEQVESVMEAHTEIIDGFKRTNEDLQARADRADELEKKVQELTDNADWKTKYEAKDKEHREYVASIAAKEKAAAVREKYKELLKSERVGDRQMEAVLRATDFSGIKIGEDGNLENVDKLREAIRRDWDGFIVTESAKGADVPNPPTGGSQTGPNTRAAELARQYHERRYGKPSEQSAPQST